VTFRNTENDTASPPENSRPPQHLRVLNYQDLLDRVGGKNEIAEEVMTNILESLPDHVALCRETFDSGRLSELRQTVHTIKGSAGTAGAEIVAYWAGRINTAIREEIDDTNAIGFLLHHLERSASDLLTRLQSEEYSDI
jgi:HPt (histidine-containing phosphotransfer) domain-containing protein